MRRDPRNGPEATLPSCFQGLAGGESLYLQVPNGEREGVILVGGHTGRLRFPSYLLVFFSHILFFLGSLCMWLGFSQLEIKVLVNVPFWL
jgi:hypothetical protein